MILEDDVNLVNNFMDNISKLESKLSQNKYPFIFLGYTSDKEYIKDFYNIMYYHDNILNNVYYSNNQLGNLDISHFNVFSEQLQLSELEQFYFNE